MFFQCIGIVLFTYQLGTDLKYNFRQGIHPKLYIFQVTSLDNGMNRPIVSGRNIIFYKVIITIQVYTTGSQNNIILIIYKFFFIFGSQLYYPCLKQIIIHRCHPVIYCCGICTIFTCFYYLYFCTTYGTKFNTGIKRSNFIFTRYAITRVVTLAAIITIICIYETITI